MDTPSAKKVVIVGDSGVGKSAIREKYVYNNFLSTHVATIGVDFYKKNDLQIWDTAGQERFKAISRSIYHGAHCVIVLFDLTSPNSFTNSINWIQETLSRATNAHFILVGAKCDLARNVTKEEIDSLLSKINIPYFEISSETGDGVNEVFSKVIELVREVNPKEKVRELQRIVGTLLEKVNMEKDMIDHLNDQLSASRTTDAQNRIYSKYTALVDGVTSAVKSMPAKSTDTEDTKDTNETIDNLMEQIIEQMMLKAMRKILARMSDT